MGRRSRKRGGPDPSRAGPPAGTATRAQRDAARAARRPPAGSRRRATDERPAAPWGSFPLSELVIFLAIVLLVASFFFSGAQGRTMLFAALGLVALGSLEVTIREHFAGFRSHSTLLAGAVGVVVLTGLVLALGSGPTALVVGLAGAAAAFAATFWALRRAFKRRSGGLGFKVR
jgi:hypothetical protein